MKSFDEWLSSHTGKYEDNSHNQAEVDYNEAKYKFELRLRDLGIYRDSLDDLYKMFLVSQLERYEVTPAHIEIWDVNIVIENAKAKDVNTGWVYFDEDF